MVKTAVAERKANYGQGETDKKIDLDEQRVLVDLMEEMSRFPLLTKEQEIGLGKKILDYQKYVKKLKKEGFEIGAVRDAYNRRNGKGPNSTVEYHAKVRYGKKTITEPRYYTIKRLEEIITIHDQKYEAVHKMVLHNLKFVFNVAKRYQNNGLGFLDLFQIGVLGSYRGAERFDYRKGYKFISYDIWWIKQAIRRAIEDQAKIVRTPAHINALIRKLNKARGELLKENGREPTEEDVIAAANVKRKHYEELRILGVLGGVSVLSIDRTFGDDNDLKYEPKDPKTDGTEAVYKRDLAEDLKTAMTCLSEREKKVLILYFGLEGESPHTLEEVGLVLKVTRERIRQIKEKALGKARNRNRIFKLGLEGYLT